MNPSAIALATTLTLTLTLALAIPLAACATTPAEDPAPVCPPTRDWNAAIDLGSHGRLKLALHGEVDVPAGMVAVLRPGPTDRMMPPGQRFTLELRPGKGEAGKGEAGRQVITGEVQPALGQYREIIVGCAGQEIVRIEGSRIETAD
jgi:hypothetical protein